MMRRCVEAHWATMEKKLVTEAKPPSGRTCGNCIHSIRQRSIQDVVVCVSQLKSVFANNLLVCQFHRTRDRED